MLRRPRRLLEITAPLATATLLLLGAPSPALAYWHGGFFTGIAPPVFAAPPPVFFPPPVYYAPPPPVVYAPPPIPPSFGPQSYPPGGPTSSAQSCYAGSYVCPMQTAVPVGGTCWCRGNNGGRVYGRAS